MRQVHPRVCGEHGGRASVPRCHARSIPACAGNTWRSPSSPRRPIGPSPRVRGTLVLLPNGCWGQPVHPRVCGEHRKRRGRNRNEARSIPACAGMDRRGRHPVQAIQCKPSRDRLPGQQARGRLLGAACQRPPSPGRQRGKPVQGPPGRMPRAAGCPDGLPDGVCLILDHKNTMTNYNVSHGISIIIISFILL